MVEPTQTGSKQSSGKLGTLDFPRRLSPLPPVRTSGKRRTRVQVLVPPSCFPLSPSHFSTVQDGHRESRNSSATSPLLLTPPSKPYEYGAWHFSCFRPPEPRGLQNKKKKCTREEDRVLYISYGDTWFWSGRVGSGQKYYTTTLYDARTWIFSQRLNLPPSRPRTSGSRLF